MRSFFILLSIILPNLLFSQKYIDISGTVTDTLNTPLNGATVLLLDPADSTLLSYKRTAENGTFRLKNVKNRPYLVKFTYVSFLPKQIYTEKSSTGKVDLGTVSLVELSDELLEVVIKEAKAPISIRGDTIEYDASTFRVPPGSSVEDLLKKLPGIQVDREGNIQSQGQDVTKVTVDGKRFFGSDPKTATKNLPAEGISKVQVFDEETEEKKLTGTSSTPANKTMNLELKEEFKKGGFGKVVGGVGTDERAELKGNYNKFDKKNQLALIGVANNTGRNGLGWNDYQDFRGSQTWNWNDDDEFGFGGSGGFQTLYFGSDDESEDGGSIQSSFFGNENAGFPENYSAGLNYNYDNKKTLFSGVYYFGQNGLLTQADQIQQVFLPENSYLANNTNEKRRTSGSHRMELRLEHEIDSLHSFVISTNGSYNLVDQNGFGNLLNSRSLDRSTINNNAFSGTYNSRGLFWKNSLVFRKKFKKKGRSAAFSAGHFYNDQERDNDQLSELTFYDEAGILDSARTVNQFANALSDRTLIKSSGLYVEPLGKRFFWQTFYNVRKRIESGDSRVFDRESGGIAIENDLLSRFYENTIRMQRVGSSLRYAYKGLNITTGLARQRFLLNGDYAAGAGSGISGEVDRTFDLWAPHFSIRKGFKRNRYLRAGYDINVNEPSVRSLVPIVDNRNPIYVRVGNPDLVPELSHRLSARFNRWDAVNFINYNINLSYTILENAFVSDQTVDSLLVTTTKTINYSGGNRASIWSNLGFPIIKNRFTVNLRYSLSQGNRFAFVNDVRNKTNTYRHRPGIRINLTPNDNISIFLNSSMAWNTTNYDINTSQNQVIRTQDHSLEMNLKLPLGLYFSSDFNYNSYENERFGERQVVPIWNASIYRTVFKNKRGEIRLSIYDALNKNKDVNQFANQNLVSETITQSLTRYGMLSFTYNMRGVKTGIKKKQGWW